jgi:uncharacterized protein (TIGR00255 family)
VVRRGTIQVQLQVRRQAKAEDFQLNTIALRAYLQQLRSLQDLALSADVPVGHLLALPGVVIEPEMAAANPGSDWPVVERVLEEALAKLQVMRQEEGRSMGEELLRLCSHIGQELERVQARAPRVVVEYRDKLHDRVQNLLNELTVAIDRSELIKEVSVFAERSDIAEEVVRLSSHLAQFRDIVNEPESPGRKLDFLTQEMFREANTIGSKANDVEIARRVVEIKSAIEKIRELIQNVE